ncbi:hypothetical protein [Streptomyces sp. NBC_00069]|uniref:hypothetical protein n=1 Tax=Streptomyces sp. NBC_00069 TaxID=2975639 RepID=UPI00324E570B
MLRTAAECALGELTLGCFPDGDFEVPLPLLHEELSSMDISFGDAVAALAVQVHGWRLAVTSAYLPQSLLHA